MTPLDLAPPEGSPDGPEPPEGRWAAALALWVTLAAGLVAALLTYGDYGPTFDEGVQATYGELALEYFRSGGSDRSCNEYLDLRYYGPLVEMLPALAYDVGDPGKYEVRHLFLGLLALLTIPGTWLYARGFGDPRVALFGLLAAVTLPRFYGHWFNNSKDVPFAVFVLLYLVAMTAMFRRPTIRWRDALWCGIAMGLALCARPGGFPLFLLYLGGGVLVWLYLVPRLPGGPGALRALARAAPKLAGVVVIAWPIMVAPWPWAHGNVLLRPVEAMREAAAFTTTVPVLFEGETVQSDVLPRYYMPKYIGIVTPLPVLVLAAVGFANGAWALLRRRGSARARLFAFTALWFLSPLALFVVLRPNVYGGMRHFLFVLPALGVFAGAGAAVLLDLVRGRVARRLALLGLLALILLPLRDLVRLHPYQMTFHNRLVGGIAGASRDYWTDYWLSSYKEALQWVNERAAREPERRFEVVIAAAPMVLIWAEDYAAPNVDLVSLRVLRRNPERRAQLAPADFYIGTSRNGMDAHYPDAPVVHSIGRDGAVFTVVRGRESPSSTPAPPSSE